MIIFLIIIFMITIDLLKKIATNTVQKQFKSTPQKPTPVHTAVFLILSCKMGS